jgi:hypothetical protein
MPQGVILVGMGTVPVVFELTARWVLGGHSQQKVLTGLPFRVAWAKRRIFPVAHMHSVLKEKGGAP